jgi:hypothetical protein
MYCVVTINRVIVGHSGIKSRSTHIHTLPETSKHCREFLATNMGTNELSCTEVDMDTFEIQSWLETVLPAT